MHFFLSCLLLTLTWALAGPVVAAVLSLLSSVVVLYIALSAKEPAVFLQLLVYAALFISVVSYLHKIQQRTGNQELLKEKLNEDVHWNRRESRKKEELNLSLEEKIHRLLDLQRFSEELKGFSELETAAGKIVKEAKEMLPKAEQCVLYLVDETQEDLSLVASIGGDGHVVKEKEGTVFDQWVTKKSQTIMVEDAQNDFRFLVEKSHGKEKLRSVCASPLLAGNRVLGVIRTNASEPGVFTPEDVRLLDIFATLGAVVLRNILLYKKMEGLAIQDSLTGVYLYRYFQGRLIEEIQRTRGDKKHFSLVFLDIDFFKRYNDEYGHAAGDIVLKNVAAVISNCLEPADLVARYGGEEFAVLLPNKGAKEAYKAAEKIRSSIEQNRFSIRRIEGSVTVSLGTATFPEDGRTKEELFWAVDKRLYEAKRSGRNRVCGSI